MIAKPEPRYVGKVGSEMRGPFVTLDSAATCDRIRPGDVLRFGIGPDQLRPGKAVVASVNASIGVIELASIPAHTVPTMTLHDSIFVDDTGDADVAAVEAYLLVCVRRRDWHGVSDAANDLRVLEATREVGR